MYQHHVLSNHKILPCIKNSFQKQIQATAQLFLIFLFFSSFPNFATHEMIPFADLCLLRVGESSGLLSRTNYCRLVYDADPKLNRGPTDCESWLAVLP